MNNVSKKYQNDSWLFRRGFIFIPPNKEGIERDKYITTCYRKKTVSVIVGDGGVAHNCPIPKYLLREVSFPEKFGGVGSSVLTIIDPFHNVPMVIAIFGKEDDVDLSEEFEKRIQSLNGENLAEIITRGKNGEIVLNVDSDQEDGGIVSITVANRNRSGKLQLKILGDSEINVSNKCSLYSNSEVDLRVENLDTDEVSSINVKGSEIVLNDNRLDSYIADINALTERYNILEDDLNTLKEAFINWVPVTTDGGAALKAITTDWQVATLIQTEVDDIKDEKIKN